MLNIGNLPAYPCTITEGMDSTNDRRSVDCKGLTKLEMVAAMCLQGLLANDFRASDEAFVVKSTSLADALLNHLQNTEK